MQPHANMGINFRKRFAFCYSKKKELEKIKKEAKLINSSYSHKIITLEQGRKMIYDLVERWHQVKGR